MKLQKRPEGFQTIKDCSQNKKASPKDLPSTSISKIFIRNRKLQLEGYFRI